MTTSRCQATPATVSQMRSSATPSKSHAIASLIQQADAAVERTDKSKALPELGVIRDQSSQWQKLPKVPEEEFEEAVRAERPSTSGIIAASSPKAKPKRNAVTITPYGYEGA